MRFYTITLKSIFLLFSINILAGCESGKIRPSYSINRQLINLSINSKEPSLGDNWMAILNDSKGLSTLRLINLKTRKSIYLPNVNRSGSNIISVAINSNGRKIAFIRETGLNREVFLYSRNTGNLRKLDIVPKGVPNRLTLDGTGQTLVVEVSRMGIINLDVFRLQL